MSGIRLEAVAEKIKDRRNRSGCVLIGVEGFGGSGKSTIASKLKDLLVDAYVIRFDDFILKEKIGEPSWEDGCFDHDRLENEVLAPASRGDPIAFRRLIWLTDKLSEPFVVPPVRYLIVEGISVYHPNLAFYYDYKLWVDVPIEVARVRGRARDGNADNAGYWDLWEHNDLEYQARFHPELAADFRIDNVATRKE